jgi:hypothetical protein
VSLEPRLGFVALWLNSCEDVGNIFIGERSSFNSDPFGISGALLVWLERYLRLDMSG